jgi:N-acetyl-gamma-glutamyl-phosphate reductase
MGYQLGLIGARGYVGQELVRLLDTHPALELAFVASRTAAGRPVKEAVSGVKTSAVFEDVTPQQAAQRDVDAYVLALGNGECRPYVDAIVAARPNAVILDISADHRFVDGWVYGLPELHRKNLQGARRIANPGCYATGAQLALHPLRDVLRGTPAVYGISGYSGANSTPSPRNNVDALKDNVMPYSLTGHTHEKEISRHLGRPVFFLPHVAGFFRGMVLTISVELDQPLGIPALEQRYWQAYGEEPLIKRQEEAPLPRDAAGHHGVTLGGFAVDEARNHAVVVVTLDNLLKGAATQALQNLNLALGLRELDGIVS